LFLLLLLFVIFPVIILEFGVINRYFPSNGIESDGEIGWFQPGMPFQSKTNSLFVTIIIRFMNNGSSFNLPDFAIVHR